MKSIVTIKIKGQLDNKWTPYFDDLDIKYDIDSTIFSGEIKDEAYLHGILSKIRNLNLKLISLDRSL